MAGLNESLNALMGIDGAQAVALVDYESGMLLGEAGAGMDMEVAAAGNTEVIRAKMKTAASLNLNDSIEDILISLGKAYHIMRPVAKKRDCSSTSCWTGPSPTLHWPDARCRT